MYADKSRQQKMVLIPYADNGYPGYCPFDMSRKGVFALRFVLNEDMLFVCLSVLRFYDPVNPVGSCRARSIYLTARLLGRLSLLSG